MAGKCVVMETKCWLYFLCISTSCACVRKLHTNTHACTWTHTHKTFEFFYQIYDFL